MNIFERTVPFRFISTCIIFSFLISTVNPTRAYAQSLNLPAPGVMVLTSPAYMPVMIKGLKVHPENPLLFDFILDTGKSRLKIDGSEFKAESQKLIKYFLASLTIKENDLWVNLSPYEKDRMITQELGQTELGRDMLAQDYILKQLTASLIYPEKELGKKFWDNVYKKAQQLYGNTQIPVNTFNKVWIVADKAKVLERNNTAYVVSAHLKVMLEEDYEALRKNTVTLSVAKGLKAPLDSSASRPQNDTHSLASQIVREVVIPELETEVNQGQNFAPLRQMFYSMILSTWYKRAIKDALLNQVYSNKAKISGVLSDDPAIKEKIYEKYLKAYKKGVFNYIKEDMDAASRQAVPRKYFSGGVAPNFRLDHAMNVVHEISAGDVFKVGDLAMASVRVKGTSQNPDTAMTAYVTLSFYNDKHITLALPEFLQVKGELNNLLSRKMVFLPSISSQYRGKISYHLSNEAKAVFESLVKDWAQDYKVGIIEGPSDRINWSEDKTGVLNVVFESGQSKSHLPYLQDTLREFIKILDASPFSLAAGKHYIENNYFVHVTEVFEHEPKARISIEQGVGSGKSYEYRTLTSGTFGANETINLNGQPLVHVLRIYDGKVEMINVQSSGRAMNTLASGQGAVVSENPDAAMMIPSKEYIVRWTKQFINLDPRINPSELFKEVRLWLLAKGFPIGNKNIDLMAKYIAGQIVINKEGRLELAPHAFEGLTDEMAKNFSPFLDTVQVPQDIAEAVSAVVERFHVPGEHYSKLNLDLRGVNDWGGLFQEAEPQAERVLMKAIIDVFKKKGKEPRQSDVERVRALIWVSTIPGQTYKSGNIPNQLVIEIGPKNIDHVDNAVLARPGGIDLNAKNMGLDVDKDGLGIEMKFDPAMVAEFQKGNFTGVEGTILRIVPIDSPLPLLGLSPATIEE